VAGADLRAAFVASCLRGALPPVDLRAVCLVRAIVNNMMMFVLVLANLPREMWREEGKDTYVIL